MHPAQNDNRLNSYDIFNLIMLLSICYNSLDFPVVLPRGTTQIPSPPNGGEGDEKIPRSFSRRLICLRHDAAGRLH